MSASFDGRAHTYAEGPPRQVPGFDGLHRMTTQLLSEKMPEDGRLLVLGAGGGLELKAFADAKAGWRFEGVDPSAGMLELARETTGTHADRIRLRQGYIADASPGPFDGAVCLLTLHFVPREQRLETLKQVHSRLKRGAPFIVAHVSFSQQEPDRSMWIARHVAYGMPDVTDPGRIESARLAIGTQLTILSPQDDEDMLRAAGFGGVNLFYAGLSFRGWVAYA